MWVHAIDALIFTLAEKQQIPIEKNVYTDKPVLRGHLWDNEKVAL
jgi:hypothetical protein